MKLNEEIILDALTAGLPESFSGTPFVHKFNNTDEWLIAARKVIQATKTTEATLTYCFPQNPQATRERNERITHVNYSTESLCLEIIINGFFFNRKYDRCKNIFSFVER